MLLALAPLMAVALGRNSEGVVLAVAVVLGVAGLIAAWRASFIAATMVIIFASFLGGRLFLLSLAGQVFILTLMATMDVWVDVGPVKRFLRRWVLDFFKAGRRQVEDEPLCLPCPLLALRAPRDEASLVIGLGQVAQGLPNAAAWLFYTAQRWPILRQFVLLVMMLLAVPAFMAFFWLPVETHDPPSIWEVILSLSYLGLLLLIVPPSVLLLVVLLLAVLAAMGISLTTGREAFMLPVVTRVEAEPLPNARASDGLRRAEMDLEILYDVRPAGLNHSLYDAGEVRDRIAIWLREQAVSSAPSC